MFHPDTPGSHLHNHIQSSTSVLSGVQSVSRVKQLLIQQSDANVVNQHNKYSDKQNYCGCFILMLVENQDPKSFASKHRNSVISNDGESLQLLVLVYIWPSVHGTPALSTHHFI